MYVCTYVILVFHGDCTWQYDYCTNKSSILKQFDKLYNLCISRVY